jgi:uncharacterized membrane protein
MKHGREAAVDVTRGNIARLEAFSDGVFAIAITLLILDIRSPILPAPVAPDYPADDMAAWLGARLGAMWPSYVAYFMSFAVIFVMWVNHHRIFTIVRRTEHAFLFWNGLLLMLVSIVPFPTELLAKYFLTPAAKVAALVYAGHGVSIALAFTGLWRYAVRRPHLLMPGSEKEVAQLSAQYRFGPLMYLVAFGLAFVSAWASIGLCLLFAVFFSFQGFVQKG